MTSSVKVSYTNTLANPQASFTVLVQYISSVAKQQLRYYLQTNIHRAMTEWGTDRINCMLKFFETQLSGKFTAYVAI